MFSERKFEERIWKGRWPVIAIAVVILLAAIQVVRVNRTVEQVEEEVPVIKYTDKGTLLTGNLWLDPNTFHSIRIDLNRKAKIVGKFNTPSSKQRVAVLVLDEPNFEAWKAQGNFLPVVTTGSVPSGRISPVIGPGTFYLVIDNRSNDKRQAVDTEFALD